MTPADLKAQLTAIQANGYSAEGINVPELMEAMLAHIGDPDPDLRDGLIYPTLVRWVGKVVSVAEMRPLLNRLLDDEHLFYRIGENGTDSVYTRSFSILAIVLVVIQHHQETHFLERDEVLSVVARMVEYAHREKDLRGYTEKGWAHSMAHLADLLDDLALCPESGKAELYQLLGIVRDAMTTSATAYTHEEDERMAYSTLTVYRRGLLSEVEWVAWFEELRNALPPRQPFTIEGYRQRVNLKQYLRSLYFQAVHKGVAPELHAALVAAEKSVGLFQYS